MNENKNLFLEKMVAQISSPWDWFAAACGAAIGAGITQLIPGCHLIGLIAAGASTGIAIKKSLIASFEGLVLYKKAKKLRHLIIKHPCPSEVQLFLCRLDFEIKLWKDGINSNNAFKNQLNKLIQDFRASRLFERKS